MIASTSSADIRLKLFPSSPGIDTTNVTFSLPSILTVPSASPLKVRSKALVRESAVPAVLAEVADVAVVADPAEVA